LRRLFANSCYVYATHASVRIDAEIGKKGRFRMKTNSLKEEQMHIPDQMLQGAVCPVTAVVGLLGVTAAVVAAARTSNKPGMTRFAAVAALIFAGQMMNFPITDGTSGHLLGGVLAASLLGAPFAVLAMSLVVAVQALVFGDGGLTVLGANLVNMALVGVAAGGMLNSVLSRRPALSLLRQGLLYGVAGWLSVMMASLAVCVELAAAGTVAWGTVTGAMLGVHGLIGVGEGLITAAAFVLLAPRSVQGMIGRRTVTLPLSAACAIAFLLSPLASGLPDGLEKVAASLRFLPAEGMSLWAPLAGYQVPIIGHQVLATGMAGLCGVLLTFALALLVARPLKPNLG
jgi:cobalt/nickel transport system permease protein